MNRRRSRNRNWRGAAAALVLSPVLALTGCRNTARVQSLEYETASWAVPLDEPGLPNFHKVSDELYRGAQPTVEGLIYLRELGVATVVSARADDRTRELASQAHLRYEHIPMSSWQVQDDQVVRFLRLFNENGHEPVFVHCQHGADRTGVLCAMYRVVIQGWSKSQAIDEMCRGGMGFHSMCENLARYVQQTDIESIRRAAGLGDRVNP